MNNEERQKHAYIGDGVYAESTPAHIILRTGDHRDGFCDNKIYLEQDVLIHFSGHYDYPIKVSLPAKVIDLDWYMKCVKVRILEKKNL